MEHNEKGFSYTYSAKERDEVEAIRKKYLPPEENKMETIRRLDARVAQIATAASLIIGILGALILGLGMSCVLVWNASTAVFVLGIALGAVGIGVTASAYPLYRYFLERERKKAAPEILRLTEELMK